MLAEQHLPRRRPKLGQGNYAKARVERIGRHYDDVQLSFSRFHAAAVNTLGALPIWARHWDAECGVWWVHPGYTERVAESLRRLGLDVEIISGEVAP
jgi:hypothetical protein